MHVLYLLLGSMEKYQFSQLGYFILKIILNCNFSIKGEEIKSLFKSLLEMGNERKERGRQK